MAYESNIRLLAEQELRKKSGGAFAPPSSSISKMAQDELDFYNKSNPPPPPPPPLPTPVEIADYMKRSGYDLPIVRPEAQRTQPLPPGPVGQPQSPSAPRFGNDRIGQGIYDAYVKPVPVAPKTPDQLALEIFRKKEADKGVLEQTEDAMRRFGDWVEGSGVAFAKGQAQAEKFSAGVQSFLPYKLVYWTKNIFDPMGSMLLPKPISSEEERIRVSVADDLEKKLDKYAEENRNRIGPPAEFDNSGDIASVIYNLKNFPTKYPMYMFASNSAQIVSAIIASMMLGYATGAKKTALSLGEEAVRKLIPAAPLGLMGAGETYTDALANNVRKEIALLLGSARFITETGSEAAGLDAIMGDGVTDRLVSDMVGEVLSKPASMAIGVAGEGLSEGVAELASNAIAKVFDKNRGLFDNVAASVAGGVFSAAPFTATQVFTGSEGQVSPNPLPAQSRELPKAGPPSPVQTQPQSRTQIQQQVQQPPSPAPTRPQETVFTPPPLMGPVTVSEPSAGSVGAVADVGATTPGILESFVESVRGLVSSLTQPAEAPKAGLPRLITPTTVANESAQATQAALAQMAQRFGVEASQPTVVQPGVVTARTDSGNIVYADLSQPLVDMGRIDSMYAVLDASDAQASYADMADRAALVAATVQPGGTLMVSQRVTNPAIDASLRTAGLVKTGPKQSNVYRKPAEGKAKAVFADQTPSRPQRQRTYAQAPVVQRATYVNEGEGVVRGIELPEIIRISEKLLGYVPQVKKSLGGNIRGAFYPAEGRIRFLSTIFENVQEATRTAAHELGHAADWVPDKDMKRGNIIGRLFSMHSFLSQTFETDAGNTIAVKEVRDEMMKVTQHVRPFDPKTVSRSHLAYRNSPAELYADFVSLLLTDPDTLRTMAPKSYDAFMEGLDRKPEFKKLYFETLEIMAKGRDAVISSRRSAVREGYAKANEMAAAQLQMKMESERLGVVGRIVYWYRMFKTAAVNRDAKLMKALTDQGMRDKGYSLLELNHVNSKVKAFIIRHFNPVTETVKKNGMDLSDLGELMEYQRIAYGDRQLIANPGGLSPESTMELIGDMTEEGIPAKDIPSVSEGRAGIANMRAQLGPEKFAVLEEQAVLWRAGIAKALQEAGMASLFSQEALDRFSKNAYYVPFRPVQYAGQKMGWGAKKQTGTLSAIENPAFTTYWKVASMIRKAEQNRTFVDIVDGMGQHGMAAKAETRWNGKEQVAVQPKEPGKSLVTVIRNGERESWVVDTDFKDSLDMMSRRSPDTVRAFGDFLRRMNMLPKTLIIGLNAAWHVKNFFYKDFQRAYKALPMWNPFTLAKLYYKVSGPVRAWAFKGNVDRNTDGKQGSLMLELMEQGIVNTTGYDIFGLEGEAGSDQVLAELGLIKGQEAYEQYTKMNKGMTRRAYEATLGKALGPVKDFIDKVAMWEEIVPKAAAYTYLRDKGNNVEATPQGPKLKPYFRQLARAQVGSPDYQMKGTHGNVLNAVFAFWTPTVSSLSADWKTATDKESRAQYLFKTFAMSILPAMVGTAIGAGAGGDELKKMWDAIPSYYRQNYIPVPIGFDEKTGKVVFYPVPMDETGRLVHGLVTSLTEAGYNVTTGKDPGTEAATSLKEMVRAAAANVPTLNFVTELGLNTFNFWVNDEPIYDDFRRKYIVTENEAKAGFEYKIGPYFKYAVQQVGLDSLNLISFYNEYVSGDKPPGVRTFLDKSLALPVVGKVIPVRKSDYGYSEKEQAVMKEIEKKSIQESIERNKFVQDYVSKKATLVNSPSALDRLAKQATTAYLGHPPRTDAEKETLASVKRTIGPTLVREVRDSRELTSLSYQSTNDMKTEFIRIQRGRMDDAKYMDFITKARRNGIISQDLFTQARRFR